MYGLMQHHQLLLADVLEHARRWHGYQEVVSLEADGSTHRQTYADTAGRACQLAHALTGLGVGMGDKVGVVAWNSHRHLEVWYGAAGVGAIVHDINPRLPAQQVADLIAEAGDTLVFVDSDFVPLVMEALQVLASPPSLVLMVSEEGMPAEGIPGALCYESLLEGQPGVFAWERFDENTANALFYTSGTTGKPKGVLYSHRSNMLHAMAVSAKDAVNIGATDVILPVVPMFHSNGWGMPYAALMFGAKLVFGGRYTDPDTIVSLMRAEGVTVALGVPTIWTGILNHLKGQKPARLPLQRAVIAGSAAAASMIAELEEVYGVEVIHCWGMTETSPIGTSSAPDAAQAPLAVSDPLKLKSKQGRPIFGVDIRICDAGGEPLPHDGCTSGSLQVRGHWVVERYYGSHQDATDRDGWFETGDIATIDEAGYMEITDRAKDLIKSGGEWISSVELENTASGHPAISQAAAVGVAHPKWEERPLLLVVPRAGGCGDKAGILEYLAARMPKWQLPEDVVFVEALPIAATGKVQKNVLRARYRDYFSVAGGAQ